MALEVNKESCIGCQCCAAVKPDNMVIEDDGKAKVAVQPETDEEKQELKDACPVGAIEEQGE